VNPATKARQISAVEQTRAWGTLNRAAVREDNEGAAPKHELKASNRQAGNSFLCCSLALLDHLPLKEPGRVQRETTQGAEVLNVKDRLRDAVESRLR
jgi:hypothetical protein